MTWISAKFKGLTTAGQERVVGLTTTRQGGVSAPPYANLNVASHVGDRLGDVLANRAILREQGKLTTEPFWLNQTHSTTTVEIPYEYREQMPADASFTSQSDTVCAVMTADCLPILLVDKNATVVAAVHAGWRGLLDGVVQNTINRLPVKPSDLSVWIGPAISKQAFEVGAEVKESFVERYPHSDEHFAKNSEHQNTIKYLADLPAIAASIMAGLGIYPEHISFSNECTYSNSERYFSYRRDGQCGRMVSLIWLKTDASQ